MSLHERVGLGDRAVDVRLGGEVDDRIDTRDRLGDGVGVLDRTMQEAEAFVPSSSRRFSRRPA